MVGWFPVAFGVHFISRPPPSSQLHPIVTGYLFRLLVPKCWTLLFHSSTGQNHLNLQLGRREQSKHHGAQGERCRGSQRRQVVLGHCSCKYTTAWVSCLLQWLTRLLGQSIRCDGIPTRLNPHGPPYMRLGAILTDNLAEHPGGQKIILKYAVCFTLRGTPRMC